jgi:hypothetical protein
MLVCLFASSGQASKHVCMCTCISICLYSLSPKLFEANAVDASKIKTKSFLCKV